MRIPPWDISINSRTNIYWVYNSDPTKLHLSVAVTSAPKQYSIRYFCVIFGGSQRCLLWLDGQGHSFKLSTGLVFTRIALLHLPCFGMTMQRLNRPLSIHKLNKRNKSTMRAQFKSLPYKELSCIYLKSLCVIANSHFYDYIFRRL